jgi:hypothetical protein
MWLSTLTLINNLDLICYLQTERLTLNLHKNSLWRHLIFHTKEKTASVLKEDIFWVSEIQLANLKKKKTCEFRNLYYNNGRGHRHYRELFY